MAKMTRAALRKLITEISKEDREFFRALDTRWVDPAEVRRGPDTYVDNEHNRLFYPENFPPKRYATPSRSMSTKPDAVQSVSNYLDMENIDDENDKKDFFGFLSHVLDYEDIDQIAQDEYTNYSLGRAPETITKADTANRFYNYPYDKRFRKLSDKYGFERVTEAIFRYIEQAADMNYSERTDFRMSVSQLS